MIVVDCSVLIAGLLPDEVEKQAQLLLEDLQHGRIVAVVPSLFYQEISNKYNYREDNIFGKFLKECFQ